MSNKQYEERTVKRHTAVRQCTCQSTWQDERYGRGMRVHNMAEKEGKHTGWRCTVCSREVSI